MLSCFSFSDLSQLALTSTLENNQKDPQGKQNKTKSSYTESRREQKTWKSAHWRSDDFFN